MKITRRSALASAAVSAITSLAGCTSPSDDSNNEVQTEDTNQTSDKRMADTTLSARVWPEDTGTGTSDGNEDWDSAGYLGGMAAKDNASDYVEAGLGITPDYTTPAFDLAPGLAYIKFTGSVNIQLPTDDATTYSGSWDQGVTFAVDVDAQTGIALTDGAVNRVYLATDLSTNDGAYVRVDTEASPNVPTDPHIQIAEIDTSADTTTELAREPDASFGDVSVSGKMDAASAEVGELNNTVFWATEDDYPRWEDVQTLADSVPAGSTIVLEPRQYPFDFEGNGANAVTITTDNITLKGSGWASEVFLENGTTNDGEGADILEFQQCANPRIENLAVNCNYQNNSPGEGGDTSDGHNIYFNSCEAPTVRNVKSYNGTGDGIELVNATGDARISDCLFYDNWEHGIGLNGCDTVTITNTIVDTEKNNALVGTFNGAGTTEVVLNGCILKNGAGHGLRVTSANDTAMRVQMNGGQILDTSGDAVRIERTSSSAALPEDVKLDGVQIVNCDSSNGAVYIRGVESCQLSDLTIKECTHSGIKTDTPWPINDLTIQDVEMIDINTSKSGTHALWVNLDQKDFTNVTVDGLRVRGEKGQQIIRVGEAGSASINNFRVRGVDVDSLRVGDYAIDSGSQPVETRDNSPVLAVSSEPSSPLPGQQIVADGANWDPDGDGNAEKVEWNGSSWVEIVDYATTL